MNRKNVYGALLSAILAAAFGLFFMFTKHYQLYAKIIPFANDPYDAIGTFAFLLSPFLLIIGFIRLIKILIKHKVLAASNLMLARTLAAIPLSVLLVLYSDCIAMARYPDEWIHAPGLLLLFSLMAGIILFAALTLVAIQRCLKAPGASGPAAYKKPFISIAIYTLVLAVYPNAMVHTPFGELIRLAVSIPLFFIPLSYLLPLAVQNGESSSADQAKKPKMRWFSWLLVIAAGIAVGTFVLFGESSENGHGGHATIVPALIMVTFVYVGTTTAAALVAYITLRKPLSPLSSPTQKT